MAGFVGAIVQIVLKQPPNTIVQGKVREVVPGQALHLDDVFFPQSRTSWPYWTVENVIIADLEVLQTSGPVIAPAQAVPPPPHQSQQHTTFNIQHVQQPLQQQMLQLADPAIVGYGRSPAYTGHSSTTPAATPTKSEYSSLPQHAPPQSQPHSIAATTIQQPSGNAQASEKAAKKKPRQPKQRAEPASVGPPPVINLDVSRNGNDMNGATKRGKGWRQTPLLQPSQSSDTKPKKQRRQRQVDGEAQNGWATEDATDIQDMGEFDFEANHKLFDKEQVFEQLRKDDTTADEERLVSHNKLPPRKNLLPSEMVLSPKLEDASDADTEVNFNGGRSSSRHSGKRQASRANSGYLDGKPHPLTSSISSDRAASRDSRSKPMPISTGVLKGRETSPQSALLRKNRSAEQVSMRPSHFVLAKSHAPCPVLLPRALETLEEETSSQYGFQADAITELAARAIAEETLQMISNPGELRRPSRTNTARGGLSASTTMEPAQSVVVILVGNHASGARAMAAARHLVTRKHKAIIAEGIFEAAAVHEPQFAKQQSILKKSMRAGASIKRGTWRKANNYIKGLSGPPVAIIDALFAGTTYDNLLDATEELTPTALEDARQMIDWANRSRAPVISITSPSGVSGYDGSAAIVDGEPLAVRPDKVLALGAPVSGLLEAIKGGERWNVSLADIGVNIALQAAEAVDFGAQWVAELQYISTDA